MAKDIKPEDARDLMNHLLKLGYVHLHRGRLMLTTEGHYELLKLVQKFLDMIYAAAVTV